MAIFPTFFLGSMGQENVFCDILEQRNAFLGYKHKKFKSPKIHIFPKGLSSQICAHQYSTESKRKAIWQKSSTYLKEEVMRDR